jgi:hypothetical protein
MCIKLPLNNQSKAYSEERVKQMEAKLLSLHRSKESLKVILMRIMYIM